MTNAEIACICIDAVIAETVLITTSISYGTDSSGTSAWKWT